MSWNFLPPERPKRRYCRLTDEQRNLIRDEFGRARWGDKGELAKRLSQQIGCSRQWVIKVALYD